MNDGQNPYYGGGGGGGFVPNGSPYGSQESPGGTKKKGGNTTIRPVTCKQVMNAAQVHPDADYTIDGHEIGQILVVGSIVNVSSSATNVQYSIGDGTGYIDVRQWLDSADDESGKTAGLSQDKYVVILGNIKNFGGKRHISASHMRAVTDHNEVYHHLLKALWVSLSLRYPGGAAGGGGHPGGDRGMQSDYHAPAAMNGAGGDDRWNGLTGMQRRIMEIVTQDDSEDGMHVSAISRGVGQGSSAQVMEAIETLMGDGMIFSTIDDLHVKAT